MNLSKWNNNSWVCFVWEWFNKIHICVFVYRLLKLVPNYKFFVSQLRIITCTFISKSTMSEFYLTWEQNHSIYFIRKHLPPWGFHHTCTCSYIFSMKYLDISQRYFYWYTLYPCVFFICQTCSSFHSLCLKHVWTSNLSKL